MAIVPREIPDEFNRPTARSAPDRSRVVKVLDIVKAAGSGVLSLMTGLLAAALILYSGYVLYDSFYTQNAAASDAWDLLQYKPEIIEEGAVPLAGGDTLSTVTEDYRAWLTMYGTNIDYAVMQGEDDLYYASHDIYGQSSLTGAIYLAAGNSGGFADSYNLLYGHHMDNGAMFGGLDLFENENYFDAHREGVLVAGTEVYDLTTFAVVRTNAYEARVYNVAGKSAADILSFIESASPVVWRAGVANDSSKILALSTCASADTDGRLVVFAVMTPRDMSEHTSGELTLRVAGYEGVYDGLEHSVTVNVNVDGATIEYSIDGGVTWLPYPPRVRYVNGSTAVLVRASYPGMESVTVRSEIRIIPRLVVVTARSAGKTAGEQDPAFYAVVTGLLGGDRLDYTVTRPGAGQDEEPGVYRDALGAAGDAVQLYGSYNVVYHPANFTITEEGKPVPIVEDIPEPTAPLAGFADTFTPSGNSFGGRCWALVNLICLLITAYILFPLLHLRDKFGRGRILEDLEALETPAGEEAPAEEEPEEEEETVEDKRKRFRRRLRTGVVAEIVTTIAALVAFILTEDMRLPMVLIDKWTPLMVVLMLLCLALDIHFVRLRDKELFEDNPERPTATKE